MQLKLIPAAELSTPSPQLARIPKGSKRLIDAGLLAYEASISGFAERYGRGETSHAIHVWWARRPHSAMRALIFACLCKESGDSLGQLLTDLGASGSVPSSVLEAARRVLKKQYVDRTPNLLDMFGGGGTIPFESLNLGAETYSIDANQLSVFLQKCNLAYGSQAKQDISTLLAETGRRVLTRLAKDTEFLYPLRRNNKPLDETRGVSTYLWTYSHACPECNYRYFLSKRHWISKKAGKDISIAFRNGLERQTAVLESRKEAVNETVWLGRNGTLKCPKCSTITQGICIDNCQDELVAVVKLNNGSGKQFALAEAVALPSKSAILKYENCLLAELNTTLPASALPRWSGIVNPALYGIRTHADFLNPRQRAVLLTLIKILRDEYRFLQGHESETTAKTIISFLSALIDQIVDWNCRLSMWIPQNEQVGRAFCGPGVPMLWDYAETDPVALGPANLWAKLERIIEGVRFLLPTAGKAHILHGYAQSLPFAAGSFDAIVTDPPYYDNIFYTVLADFFFAWKRLLLCGLEPALFSTQQTDDSQELVSSVQREGSSSSAHERYCAEFSKAIAEGARVLRDDGVFALVYSHSSLKGWEAFLRAYRSAPVQITSVQPLSIERRQRPRAMNSEAVNTCLAFVARKIAQPKNSASLPRLKREFSDICDGKFAGALESAGWNEADIALAVYAQGVALLANVSKVDGEESTEQTLAEFEEVVTGRFPNFTLQKRGSL